MKILYGTATNVTNLISASISESHSATNTVANIECESFSGTVGSQISIDIGYTDNHGVIFTGYVKSIEHNVPDNLYTIIASDILVRASDFFIVPDSPDTAFSRQNISAEDLVHDVLALSGLTSFDLQATSYTLAVNGTTAEVKLISSYDYCKSIADLVAWHLWADRNGVTHFRNRKPYVMTGTSGQPGDVADTPLSGKEINDTNSISGVYRESEADLRNKVVVWGYNGITATASAVSSYLPTGFYKTVLFSNQIIDSTSMANATATYNLALLNRLTKEVTAITVGDWELEARNTIDVNLSAVGINQEMYIFSADHSWSQGGYEVTLVLKV